MLYELHLSVDKINVHVCLDKTIYLKIRMSTP